MEFKTKAEANALLGATAVQAITSNCLMYSLTDGCTNCKSEKCEFSPSNPNNYPSEVDTVSSYPLDDNYEGEPIDRSEVANEIEQIKIEKGITLDPIDNYDDTMNLISNLVSADVLTMYNTDGNLFKVGKWDITAIANAVILYKTDPYFKKHVEDIYFEWERGGYQ